MVALIARADLGARRARQRKASAAQKARNIDSKHRSVGFDNCSFATQRRVLQHNPRNGKSRWITPAALTVRTCPRDSDVESPSSCYALTTRGCLSEERYQSTPAASNNAGTSPTR